MAENKIEIDVDLAIKDAVKGIDALNKKFDSFSQSASDNSGKASGAFATFKGALGAMQIEKLIQLATDAAKQLFQTFIVDGVKAASEQEKAITALNVSLANTGNYSEEASLGIQELASSLEQTTVFSEEQVLQNAALIESMGKLSGEGLKRATQAAVDLAAAYNIDLESASRLIGKAAEGNVTAFQRMGIQIEKSADDAKTFENTLRALAGAHGTAEAQAKNFSGQTKILGESFQDIQEESGKIVTENKAVLVGMSLLGKEFRAFAGTVKDNKGQLQDFVEKGIFIVIDSISTLLTIMDGAARFVQAIWNVITAVFKLAAALIVTAMHAISSVVVGFIQLLPGMGDAFQEELDAMGATAGEFATDVGDDFKDVGKAFSESGALESLAGKVDEFGVRYRAALEEEKKADEDRTDHFKKQSDERNAASEAEMKKKRGFEFQALFEIAKFETLTSAEKIQRHKETLGVIAGLTKSKNAELFRIGQAAAIANATIDGISAVVKALASAPPPFNFILAGLVGTAVAVQIADIASTPPPAYAQGGVVPGTAYAGDRNIARVNSGEMILTMQDQLDLLGQIRNGQGGGGGSTFIVQGNVIADDDYQVDRLIDRIRDRLEFNNASLAPVV